jgi:hypothetical protein
VEGKEFRSRYGRIVIDETGVTVVELGTAPIFVPWYAVGHMENVDLGSGSGVGWARLVRMHLADGRVITLPAPRSGRGGEQGFDVSAAEIFRAWRKYSRARIHETQDEISPVYRAEIARSLERIEDAVPSGEPIEDEVPSGGASVLRRWIRWRLGR